MIQNFNLDESKSTKIITSIGWLRLLLMIFMSWFIIMFISSLWIYLFEIKKYGFTIFGSFFIFLINFLSVWSWPFFSGCIVFHGCSEPILNDVYLLMIGNGVIAIICWHYYFKLRKKDKNFN